MSSTPTTEKPCRPLLRGRAEKRAVTKYTLPLLLLACGCFSGDAGPRLPTQPQPVHRHFQSSSIERSPRCNEQIDALPLADGGLQPDLIIVPEDDTWTIYLATALAGRCAAQTGTLPPLLVVRQPVDLETRELVAAVNAKAPLSALSPETSAAATLPSPRHGPEFYYRFAEQHWEHADTVVLAPQNQPQDALLAATLAAHLGAPVFGVNTAATLPATFIETIRKLDVKKLLLVSVACDSRTLTRNLPDHIQVEYLGRREAMCSITSRSTAARGRNVILTREPDSHFGSIGAFAPYLSVRGKAPVAVTSAFDTTLVQQALLRELTELNMYPDTITILGDCYSIGLVTVEIPDQAEEDGAASNMGGYTVDIEPFSNAMQGGDACPFGVGRLPWNEAHTASAILLRQMLRERNAVNRKVPSRTLLIANPESSYGSLPLCETISRAMGEDFRNCGATLDAFYGVRVNEDAVLNAAANADLIIFEGHIVDFTLFPETVDSWDGPTGFADGMDDEMETAPMWHYGGPLTEGSVERSYTSPPPLAQDVAPQPNDEQGNQTVDAEPADTAAPESCIPVYGDYMEEEYQYSRPESFVETLNAHPVVILQSCHSLETDAVAAAFRRGAIAVIGTSTNVHSASGASFIKAFCDAALYRNCTLGEALRDARSFMLSFATLKDLRGHRQQAKARRVAYSFCLYGDPEARLLPGTPVLRHSFPPITWSVEPGGISLKTPGICLPRVQTERYYGAFFPCTELAGIVMSKKGVTARRIRPIYFDRLPVLSDTISEGALTPPDGTRPAGVAAVDPFRRAVYLTYLADRPTPAATIRLQLEDRF